MTRAASFLGTLGVDTHIPYTDGGYANIGNVAADLAYLGISHVRDGVSDGLWGSAPLSSYIKLAQQGITFTVCVVDGTVTDTASLNARLALVQRLIEAVPGSVTMIEGANEIDNWPVTYNGVSGMQGALDLQRDIYAAVHGRAAFAGVGVAYFTGYGGALGAGPDPSATPGLADFDTQHPYPRNGTAPRSWMDPAVSLPNEKNGVGPAVYTETGYSSNGGTWAGVDLAVQAKYTLDLLFDAASDGIAQTDLYELMDAYATGSPQGNDGYGLFNTDNSPKPVATALHNLTTILADTAADAATFQTQALTPTITGLPATGASMVLQKASGAFDVVVWAEPQIWDAATGTEMAAPTSTVTVALGRAFGTVSVFDPLAGTGALTTLHDVASVVLALTDHPLIVEASGSAAPTVSITRQVLATDTGSSATDNVTSNGAVTLSGTATGVAGTRVQVMDGAAVLGAAALASDGTWSFATVLSAGTHSLTAVATDPTGLSATSAAAAAITVVPGPTPAGQAPQTIVNTGAITLADVVLADGLVLQNAGTVTQTGTVQIGDAGSQAAGLANAAGATYRIAGDLDIAAGSGGAAAFTNDGGLVVKTAGTGTGTVSARFVGGGVAAAIAVQAGTLKFVGTGNDFAGQVIGGAGTFFLGGGGTTTIEGGTALGTAAWAIARAGTTVTFGQDLTYVGAFSATNRVTLDLGTHMLALAGSAAFATGPVGAPVVTGTGTLALSGTATVRGLTVGGSVQVQAGGAVTQTGAVTLGDAAAGTPVLSVTGRWDLAGDVSLAAAPGVAPLVDLAGGTLVKSAASGTRSIVAAALCNSGTAIGTVEVAAGKLELGGALTGVLALQGDAGTTLLLDKSAAAGTTFTYAGPGATLQLNDAPRFAGAIAGFGAGEKLDLRSLAFDATRTTLGYADGGQGGTLTVSDGSHTACLALSGPFAADGFHLSGDGHGGSLVTYG